ncbi:MAG: 3'(2'),5'-bisphosphate nucleotidase CysQ [Rhizobiaceae bacterium]
MKEILIALSEMVAGGGRIAMQHHCRLTEVLSKEDETPLTAADLAVDEYLCQALADRFPDIPVVTEERVTTHKLPITNGRFFLVDPIDGTKEFVAERGEFTINVGLIENGVPIAGAVCAPAIGRLFAGANDIGAFEGAFEDGSDNLSALVPSKPDNDGLNVVASRSHLTPETGAFIEANKVAGTVNAGSSLKFCLLAAGEADLYPRFGPTMEWDTAAGHAVLAAAGGFVEEISRVPLKYGKPDYRNPNFIAYTPGTQFTLA